jgi:hypothetical protein
MSQARPRAAGVRPSYGAPRMTQPPTPTPLGPRQAAQRDQLLAWIAGSERRQRTAGRITMALLVPAIASLWLHRTAGIVAVVLVGSIGFIAYWVTAAHIADFRQQLEHLRTTGRTR